MNLKKINPKLQQALVDAQLTEPNEVQLETYATIKSGADVVVQSGLGTGKSIALALHTIQKLDTPFQVSPRALIFCNDKEKVFEMVEIFEKLNKYNKLRIYHVHEKSNFDDDKNQISAGIDVLIGTPNRLNEMFSSAGFDVNRLLLFMVDDADILFRNRLEPKVVRISDSIAKVQRIFFCSEITEKIEIVADKIMIDPIFFEN